MSVIRTDTLGRPLKVYDEVVYVANGPTTGSVEILKVLIRGFTKKMVRISVDPDRPLTGPCKFVSSKRLIRMDFEENKK